MGAYGKKGCGTVMVEQKMPFQVGDQIIHWVYGPGEIIALDEKTLSGHADQYYVLKIRDLTIWVPVKETGESCLRYPTAAEDFQKLVDILSSPVEELPADRYDRRTQLTLQMKIRSLDTVCRIIRDLTFFKHNNKVNDNDNSILVHAKNTLMYEWSVALKVSLEQAEQGMNALIDVKEAIPQKI